MNTPNIKIDHNYIARIVAYFNSYAEGEQLTAEQFNEAYGSVMGNHYWNKWFVLYKQDYFKMIAYFGYNSEDGQKFCDMVATMVDKYEQRIERVVFN